MFGEKKNNSQKWRHFNSTISESIEQQSIDILNGLLQLTIDLSLAYRTAIRRIDSAATKRILIKLDTSHDRYRVELADAIETLGGKAAQSGDLHGILERGRVVLGELSGDEGILSAMAANEMEVSDAYREALRFDGFNQETRTLLERTLEHEKEHHRFYDTMMQDLAAP